MYVLYSCGQTRHDLAHRYNYQSISFVIIYVPFITFDVMRVIASCAFDPRPNAKPSLSDPRHVSFATKTVTHHSYRFNISGHVKCAMPFKPICALRRTSTGAVSVSIRLQRQDGSCSSTHINQDSQFLSASTQPGPGCKM